MKRSLRPSVAAASLAVLAGGLLPAPATAAVEGLHLDSSSDVYVGRDSTGADCTTSVARPARTDPAFSDNGYWSAGSWRYATAVRTAAGADDTQLSVSGSLRARQTPYVGGPATFDATLSVAGSLTPSTAAPSCTTQVTSGPEVWFDFTVTRPQWFTLSASAKVSGSAHLDTNLLRDDAETGLQVGNDGSGSTTVYLAPGRYSFEAVADLLLYASRPERRTGSVSGSVHATWAAVGSAASGQSGRAGRFVTFAAARDCGRGTLGATLSSRLRKKAKRVDLLVNGQRRVTLKRKRLAARSATLTGLPATSRVTVTTVVTPKKGKRLTATRSYLACR